MDVLAIPRTAVDRSIRILRLPLDTTLARLSPDGAKASAVSLGLDRVDAAVRRIAGRVLHDELLQQDAQARGIAVGERQRALELRAEAELRRRRADAELQAGINTADERRAAAEKRADEERARVDEARRAESRRLAEQTERRRMASRKAEERTEESIDERAQKARLDQLMKESDVLDAQEDLITTTSEAQRLQRAASEAKAERKSE